MPPPGAPGADGAGPSGSGRGEPRRPYKRRQRERNDSDDEEKKLLNPEDVDDDYEEYVPVAKRRALAEAALRQKLGLRQDEKKSGQEEDEGEAEPKSAEPEDEDAPKPMYNRTGATLLQQVAAREGPQETEEEVQLREELELMRQLAQKQVLQSVGEIAKGVVYDKALDTGWTPPSYIASLPPETIQAVRDEMHIIVEGNPPIAPPITTWHEMRLPKPICDYLVGKGIKRPTPIQLQGMPVALTGRDMIGIAFTGSGKTLSFALPMIMSALQEEVRMPLEHGEGPIAITICPSRELAKQTLDVIKGITAAMETARLPKLGNMLIIGGIDMRTMFDGIRNGVHIAVATPGRLKDMLSKEKINLDICRFLCLDEADRMVDLGFEEDIREIISYFKGQRQTIMYSATMPDKIKSFAESALVDPILVNVGRAGAANMDVVQEVEYVKAEAKLPFLLRCLQKTAPPVLVFAENKRDVDLVHEYLLVKGVEAVALHGGKDQSEREHAIESFRAATKDVLVASDVAGKGLDFPNVEHVINYDMPSEIENYVHRIGRTGRAGKTGIATTFINRDSDELILLDLKHLLKEAKQRMPPVLAALEDPMDKYRVLEEASGHKGCAYCGGLGHRINNCPKLRADNKAAAAAVRDKYGGDGFGGEM